MSKLTDVATATHTSQSNNHSMKLLVKTYNRQRGTDRTHTFCLVNLRVVDVKDIRHQRCGM